MSRDLTPAESRQRRLAPIKTGVYATSPDALKLRYRKVRRLVRKMKAAMPWLDPADEPAARAWAEMEILAAGMFVELTANGVLTAAGEPRRLLSEYRQIRQAQLGFWRELGGTPVARMALQVGDSRVRAVEGHLDALRARGREARKAVER